MKTIQQLEDELESLWNDFERIQKESADKTDEIRLLRRKLRELKETEN